MKKFLAIIILGLLWCNVGFADTVTKFKCNFERDNYEYTINLYEKEFNELHIRNMKSKFQKSYKDIEDEKFAEVVGRKDR